MTAATSNDRANGTGGASDTQRSHWNQTYTEMPVMYGTAPSVSGLAAAEAFAQARAKQILELGGGHGRDTFPFAERHFDITVLDYSKAGIATIIERAREEGLTDRISALTHDARESLPFPDASFDACYSHMLFCMAMSTDELWDLSREVWRILRPGGLQVYTVRHKGDAHYGFGTDHGDDRFETGGFEVHFFDLALVGKLAQGFDLVSIDAFEEGALPRRLWRITLRKPQSA